jgi:mannose-6-phosphate isomerase-like protein (cupin superfamily)
MNPMRQLSNELHRLPVLLDPSPDKWKPHHLFNGSTPNLDNLGCHMSGLVKSHSPHPPHEHPHEELLLVLANSVDIILPNHDSKQMRLTVGDFVYYPAGFSHTIVGVSDEPANYFMLKWRNDPKPAGDSLRFEKFETFGAEPDDKGQSGWKARKVFEGRTEYLSKLHCHVSQLSVGAGYQPHVDAHDVAMILIQGEVDTLGQRLPAPAVIFHSAGEPHGICNVGNEAARYVVFEFHRNGKSN